MSNSVIRKVSIVDGQSTIIAGLPMTSGYVGDGGSALDAKLSIPYGLEVDGSGNIYVADANNHRIRKIDTNGIITTIAGTGTSGYSGDSGAATSAKLNNPTGIDLYIIQRGSWRWVNSVFHDFAIDRSCVSSLGDSVFHCSWSEWK